MADRTPIDLASRLTLRPEEAARVLGVSARKLRAMLPSLPHFRDGGTVLISVDGLRRWISERTPENPRRAASPHPSDAQPARPLDGRAVAGEILGRITGT